MNDLVYKDKEIKIFHVQSELKNYNHKGVPYSNSLFAWEDNYNIEFSLFYKKDDTIAYCTNRYIVHYSFGRIRLTDISGELRNQQYKRIKQITNMPNEEEMIDIDKKMNKKFTHLETFFKQEFCKKSCL